VIHLLNGSEMKKTLRRIVVRTNLILLAQLVSLIAKRFLAFAEPL
jgi:hypothetical protein